MVKEVEISKIKTHIVVLKVSTGRRTILKAPAAKEAATVFTELCRSRVDSKEFNAAIIPLLAAVSPKRDKGPCAKAGINPL
jgi:hypothetical protein